MVPAPSKDSRLKYHADLRVDDVQDKSVRERPLEQFIDGFYCDRCNKGFVSEEVLKEGRTFTAITRVRIPSGTPNRI